MADLFISWDEYHKKTEELAIKVFEDGWEFNQVVCIAKGGMRVGDVFARIFFSKILLLFFRTELDLVRNFFLGLNIVFLFPNRIQFGSENFIEFVKICFPNRIGIGSETDTV